MLILCVVNKIINFCIDLYNKLENQALPLQSAH